MVTKAAQTRTGLFTLTAPTGGDKTLAMLKFALDHARYNNLQRFVRVVPYLPIIEQTEAVAGLVSNFMLDNDTKSVKKKCHEK